MLDAMADLELPQLLARVVAALLAQRIEIVVVRRGERRERRAITKTLAHLAEALRQRRAQRRQRRTRGVHVGQIKQMPIALRRQMDDQRVDHPLLVAGFDERREKVGADLAAAEVGEHAHAQRPAGQHHAARPDHVDLHVVKITAREKQRPNADHIRAVLRDEQTKLALMSVVFPPQAVPDERPEERVARAFDRQPLPRGTKRVEPGLVGHRAHVERHL